MRGRQAAQARASRALPPRRRRSRGALLVLLVALRVCLDCSRRVIGFRRLASSFALTQSMPFTPEEIALFNHPLGRQALGFSTDVQGRSGLAT